MTRQPVYRDLFRFFASNCRGRGWCVAKRLGGLAGARFGHRWPGDRSLRNRGAGNRAEEEGQDGTTEHEASPSDTPILEATVMS